MLICDVHWTQMGDKAKELGMQHLCTCSAKEAADDFSARVRGTKNDPVREDIEWDPLVIMSFNFMKRVLLTIGWTADCPLCVVRGDFDAHNTPTGGCGDDDCPIRVTPGEEAWDLQWISGCADAMRDEAARRGLLTRS